ncbi:NUDIX hydrolase [Paenibacillus sp. IB182496]|uniref:NUDIX hydrolase n=1 Tax=Paenibacillus sabuli TaxID=2772509 RepID=A0A927BWI6_9BACL|nr:NUDIX hydrolase [Paenibacillus sabuli]MBD2846759.1 NUDIX hydrolase [Paenibacillus sabuli]
MEIKHCASCGGVMESRDMDGFPRKACPDCGYVHWGNYSVGVGALVLRENKLLLVRRAQEPGKGFWTNPGGYMEQTETIEETVCREVREEAGIEAQVRRIVGLRDQPRSIHNVYIAFAMDYISGEPRPDMTEVDAAGFYSRDEMETMHVAPFTRWLAQMAFEPSGSGLRTDDAPLAAEKGYLLYRI